MSNSEVCEKAVFELCALDDLSCPPAEVTDNPVWPRVSESLERIYEVGGFVELRVSGGSQGFVKRLYMKAIPGKYRLVILTRSSDPKAELQEWWESGSSKFRGVISIGDDEWDARTVCSDLSVAKVIFKEFFDSGDLSSGLRQMRSQWDPKP
ncbi:DUF6911 family protein [Pseudomonas protegens]|uniref:DUF6911 family protein n=1 Tax=Pseudomonas protegens TaxID=380021 RepID=UPI00383B699F